MKILFVIDQLDYADHISIAYLSAVAKDLGHETRFTTLNDLFHYKCDTGKNYYRLYYWFNSKKVDISTIDVVAYSCTIAGFKKIVDFNNQMKKYWNHISILGGAHATFAPETIEESGIDYYCIGEGEATFKEFLQKIGDKRKLRFIPNLISKNNKNKKLRSLIQDLDSLPVPDRDLTISNSFLKDTSKKTFYTTRNCPFSCSYCANNHYNAMYRGQKIVRRFSVDRVIAEMKDVKSKYRMDFVKIGDDLFALKADRWLEEFAEKYKREIDIPFNCYLRIDSVNTTLMATLKSANCHSVHLSIDSLSPYVREKIFKRKCKSDNKEILEKLKLIHSFGIKTWVNFMLSAPGSTFQDDLDTIKFSKKAKITYTSYSITDPIKNTDLYNYCLEKGYITKDYNGDMSNCSNLSPLSCFREKEKKVSYNVYLLGAIFAKIPFFLIWIFSWFFFTKPNKFYKKLHDWFYKYNIENKIFKLN